MCIRPEAVTVCCQQICQQALWTGLDLEPVRCTAVDLSPSL